MYELKRVLKNRGTAFLLFFLTAVACVLFRLSIQNEDLTGIDEYQEVYTERYHELIEEFKDYEPNEALEELTRRSELRSAILPVIYFEGMGEFFDYAIEDLQMYYPEIAEEYYNGKYDIYRGNHLLLQAEDEASAKLIQQFEYIAYFNDYYASIKKSAERMQNTSLFGDPNSFAYRNTMKTVEDFAPIEGSTGKIGDDRAVTSLFSDPIVDYFILIFIAYACIVMLRERKSGLWHLVRSTPNGKLRLALNRMGVLLAFSIVGTVFIFGSRFAMSYLMYDGFSYSNRLIQSIEGFSGICNPMSVNSFMAMYFGIKVICTFAAGLVICLLLSSVKNTNIAIGMTAIVVAVEYVFYSTINDNSILVPLKYLNIFQLVQPSGFTITYLNLNINEHPINMRTTVTIMLVIVAVAAIIGYIAVQCKKRPTGPANPLEKLYDRFRKLVYRFSPGAFVTETSKSLIIQRGIVVLALLVFAFASFGELPNAQITIEQRYAMSYYERYAGSVSENTLLSLDEDIADVQEIIDILIENDGDPYEIEAQQKTIDGIEYLKAEVQNIIAYNESGEHDREILLTPPYHFLGLFGTGAYKFQNNSGLLALLFMSLFIAGMFAYERQSNMTKLLCALPNGRQRLFLKKQAVILLFTALVFAGIYLPELISAARQEYYGGWQYLNHPIQGIQLCRDWSIQMSVGGFVVLVYAMRFTMLFLIGNLVAFLSSLSEKVNSATIMACAVMVVPACIVSMEVDGMYNFTALPALGFTQNILYGGMLPLILSLAICIIALAVNAVRFCRLNLGLSNKVLKRK